MSFREYVKESLSPAHMKSLEKDIVTQMELIIQDGVEEAELRVQSESDPINVDSRAIAQKIYDQLIKNILINLGG